MPYAPRPTAPVREALAAYALEQIVLALQASFAMLQASMGDLTEEPDDDG